MAGWTHEPGAAVVPLGTAPPAPWPSDGVLADLADALDVEGLPATARRP